MSTNKKWNVVFEQYVIPHYRVAFFSRLAKLANLTVIASTGSAVDGLNDVTHGLPFEALRFQEAVKGSGFHAEIFDVLKDKKADAYVSYGALLTYLLSKRTYWRTLRASGAKIFWMGCDGYWVRDFKKEKWNRWMTLNPKRFYRLIREAIVIHRTDGFICHSTHMREYFRIVHGVPERKLFLAQNAIDTATLSHMRRKFEAEHVRKKPRSMVFVGRLAEGKKIDMLLHAFAAVAIIYPDASLTIIGEGSAMESLKALARNLNIDQSVRFTGGIYDETVLARETYSSSLYVLPGLGGLGINTAMAMGLPIVASFADGTEDDLITTENGWRFDGTEAMLVETLIKALTDVAALNRMGKISADIIEHRYNLENMVHQYIRALDTILSK